MCLVISIATLHLTVASIAIDLNHMYDNITELFLMITQHAIWHVLNYNVLHHNHALLGHFYDRIVSYIFRTWIFIVCILACIETCPIDHNVVWGPEDLTA